MGRKWPESRPRGRKPRGMEVETKPFKDRADTALLLFGGVLPRPVKELLRDMAVALDELREQKQ